MNNTSIASDPRNYRRFSTRSHSRPRNYAEEEPQQPTKQHQEKRTGKAITIKNADQTAKRVGKPEMRQSSAGGKTLIQAELPSWDHFKKRHAACNQQIKELKEQMDSLEKMTKGLRNRFNSRRTTTRANLEAQFADDCSDSEM